MASSLTTPLGPLFGPDFLEVTAQSAANLAYTLTIFPDAQNPSLRAAGLPQAFYFLPQRIYLAKKQNAPADYDFAMMMFKGLMTSETTIGVSTANETDGEVGTGGALCTFSTTFGIPPEVIASVKSQLQNPNPAGQKSKPDFFQNFFGAPATAPPPTLGMVPIIENNVTVDVPTGDALGDSKNPVRITAQGAGKGSIDETSISSFLITMNMLAAGIIGGALKNGLSPFVVNYNLKEAFYINACTITVNVDMDKTFDQFSSSVDVGGWFGDFNFSQAYQSCVTSGAITTIVNMDGAILAPDSELKKMIDTEISDLQKFAMDQVKADIFSWQPQPDAPASASKGLIGSIFGGAGVSMKSDYQRHSDHNSYNYTLNSTVAVMDTKSGDLSDLQPAIKANLAKYYTVVDIGDAFQKVQVAARASVNWNEKAGDIDLSDPVTSIQLEVGYPDYTTPLGADNKANPQYRGSGSHFQPGGTGEVPGVSLSVWTAKNANDIVNVDFLKMAAPAAGWDVDQVALRKTIVYNPSDRRVDLANGHSTVVIETLAKDHAPVITPDEVGYVFVKFHVNRRIQTDNISVTLTIKLAGRTDTLVITRANADNAVWEVFSDKYLNETQFTYTVQVEVDGPNFTDDPIVWGGDQVITVALPSSTRKAIPFEIVAFPEPPADQLAAINNYIKNYKN